MKTINIQQDIINWLHENCEGNYTISFTETNEIIINGNIALINHKIEELPYKFVEVNGDFSIGGFKFYNEHKANQHAIKTLKNCPDIITGNFNCALCPNLTSLQYGPIKVGGNYFVHNTGIESFAHIAKEIGKDIIAFCNFNLIDIGVLHDISFHHINIDQCVDFVYGSEIFKQLKLKKKISNNNLYSVFRTNLAKQYNEANHLV